MLSKVKYFQYKITQGKWLKITPKQMYQKSLIALAKVKAGDTFENLLNEIRQMIYSLYQPKEIFEKLYNNIMNSVKLIQKWKLDIWILKIVKHLILIDYYSVLQNR